MPLSLKSIGGGNVSLDAPATASDYTVNIPTTTGTLVAGDSTTGALVLPSGSTTDRPAVPYNGAMRWNSTLNRIEIFSNFDWYDINYPIDPIYNINRSLRFRASASAYLSRTPASYGNQLTWTWCGWVKRGVLTSSNRQTLLQASSGGAYNFTDFCYDAGTDSFRVLSYNAGTKVLDRTATPSYRDPAGWYFVILAWDMTQATAANRQRLYVGGVEVTSWTNTTTLSQNSSAWINSTQPHYIGRDVDVSSYFDGYLSEVNFIDGQALTPSSFGSTNSTTGVWQPAPYTGTYGTNGFYLPFTDNSSLTTSSNVGLGKDFSGNGNYWVTNNISITSGVTYDSMTDVPTLTSATAANFAVLNPLDSASGVLTNGNLQFTSSGNAMSRASMAMPAGKWYAEVTFTSGSQANIGIATSSANLASYLGSDAFGWGYAASGVKINNNTTAGYGAAFTIGDVIGITFDTSNGQLTFYKNNVSQGVAYTVSTTGTYFFALGTGSCGNAINFGQRPFAYTPPSGFVALNTYNLPDSTIKQGNKVMDATLYTGNLVGQVITNAAGFKPDLVWPKSRSAATDNKLVDSVRGATLALVSNSTAAETTDLTGVVSFNSNGFTLGTSTTYNNLAATYVAWQWQAGQGSTSSNTSGTITSTVSVNATAGFSVVTYTGTGANATVGHGLGVAPSLVIVKRRSATESWSVYHSSLPSATYFLYLNLPNGQTSASTVWNSTAPTSSVISVGTDTTTNASTSTYVAYCFASIEGYSAFGKYTGNGSTDGTFVYTGFRPKYVLIKSLSTTGSWATQDTSRDPYNADFHTLFSELSSAEYTNTAYNIDILSNGFKLRQTNADINTNGTTYAYIVFAENPFKNSLAR